MKTGKTKTFTNLQIFREGYFRGNFTSRCLPRLDIDVNKLETGFEFNRIVADLSLRSGSGDNSL